MIINVKYVILRSNLSYIHIQIVRAYYTPRVCSSKCHSIVKQNMDWSNHNAIVKKNRKALKKDKVKYNAFVEKVKINQRRIWADRKVNGTFEDIHVAESNRNKKTTLQHSHHYKKRRSLADIILCLKTL